MTMEKTEKAVKILLVEDNMADAILMEMLLADCSFAVQIRVARDGEEALKLLHGSSSFEGKGNPDLILLDLNLPKVDGHQVLGEIKKNPDLKHIPVLVLTSSNDPSDIALAKQNQADDYLVKGIHMDELNATVKRIENFWLKFKKGAA